MVSNAISDTLASQGLEPCLAMDDGSTDMEPILVVVNNVTMNCSDVKVNIAVTVAFMSGAMMVSAIVCTVYVAYIHSTSTLWVYVL